MGKNGRTWTKHWRIIMDHKEKTSIKNERNFVIYFRNSLNKLKAKTK